MVTIFSDSCSDLLNKSKNTPPKFFPREIGDVNFFGPKNRKIRVQNGSKWAQNDQKSVLMLKFSWKAIRKYQKESPQCVWKGSLMWVGDWQPHCDDISWLRHIMSHQAWVYAQFGSKFRIFFRDNGSISCFETWWTDSSPWKEAIALFSRFFRALFGVTA